MLSDAGEHVGEPGLRIDVVHLDGDDQRVHKRGSFAAAVGAGEQPGLAAERIAAQRAFGGVVGQAVPVILEEAGKARPSLEHVIHGRGEWGVAREPGALRTHPGLEISEQGCRSLRADPAPLFGAQSNDLALDLDLERTPPAKAVCHRL